MKIILIDEIWSLIDRAFFRVVSEFFGGGHKGHPVIRGPLKFS